VDVFIAADVANNFGMLDWKFGSCRKPGSNTEGVLQRFEGAKTCLACF
jgi:hypothetical protein